MSPDGTANNYIKITAMKKYTPLLFICAIAGMFCGTASAQDETAMNAPTASEIRAREAYSYLDQLHNGFLLVRLSNKTESINALRKGGNHEDAEELEREQRKKNLEIVKAFKQAYTFSPVYFIWTDSSHLILENEKPSAFPLLNENLEVDKNITAPDDTYLVGDFSRTSSENTVTVGNDGTPRTNMEFPAFVVRNRQLVQIAEPFPYYVRTFEQVPGEQTPMQVVKRLNAQLYEFYRPEAR